MAFETKKMNMESVFTTINTTQVVMKSSVY